MPARLIEIAGGMGAAIVGEADIVGGDLTEATRQLLRWEDARLAALVGGIVDLTHASSFKVESSRIETLVELDLQLATKVRKGFLVGVAAPGDLQFGMSRMWQTLAEATHWEILVVRNHAEVSTWFRSRASQKFGVELPGGDLLAEA